MYDPERDEEGQEAQPSPPTSLPQGAGGEADAALFGELEAAQHHADTPDEDGDDSAEEEDSEEGDRGVPLQSTYDHEMVGETEAPMVGF